jgi:N-acetylated-alpha-linked acidic dipeptidase
VTRTLLPLALLAAPLGAQQPTGFSPASAARQAATEAILRATPDTGWAARHARTLAARPHVAGTPAQQATADYVLRQMAAWGLDTARQEFEVYLPFHDSTIVELVAPTRHRFVLDEPALAADPTSAEPPFPAMNGYSGAGDVTAPVVYVNYGLAADYATLDSLGISVAGKVVLARYGRAFRGIKPREAERRGAAAVLLYSDPLDDGFLVGDVYPAGPMRNPDGVQRGSILNGQGDPTTPGWASVPGARRRSEAESGLPGIPVVPIGYGNARRILEGMGGPSVPNAWQGGLGFRYHLGDDGVRMRVAVWPERGTRAFKRIFNTYGTIRGALHPDQVVLIGGHRDAWSPGAVDNVSGVVSILEAARAWSQAVASGHRPARTLVFATWDAEEWGLIGAVEHAELHGETLVREVVAYINQDVTASGPMFSAGGTASLHQLVRDVTATVPQPRDSVTVFRDWQRRTSHEPGAVPSLGDLGGGSDFVAFYNHLGIPAIAFGFGGPGGSYHSGYDSYTFMERFGDPGYAAHRAAAVISAVLMARLANAEALPHQFGTLGAHLRGFVTRVARAPGGEALAAELAAVGSAAERLEREGAAFSAVRDRAVAGGAPATALERANALVMQVEPTLVSAEGLRGRPFMRNLVLATDRNDGYANVPFPAIMEALQDGDVPRARAASGELAAALGRAAALVERARAVLLPFSGP